MEIHELNTFSGTPGAGDFLATDNGTDTAKIAIKTITDPLDARIDNIIAGPASSAQEVIDARLGADGITYSSLGDAIRTQVTDLKNDLNQTDLQSTAFLERHNGWLNQAATSWLSTNDVKYQHIVLAVSEGEKFKITPSGNTGFWAFLTSYDTSVAPATVGGRQTSNFDGKIPANVNYVYVGVNYNGNATIPSVLKLGEWDYSATAKSQILKAIEDTNSATNYAINQNTPLSIIDSNQLVINDDSFTTSGVNVTLEAPDVIKLSGAYSSGTPRITQTISSLKANTKYTFIVKNTDGLIPTVGLASSGGFITYNGNKVETNSWNIPIVFETGGSALTGVYAYIRNYPATLNNKLSIYVVEGELSRDDFFLYATSESKKLLGKKVAWYGDSITQEYHWCETVNAAFGFDAVNCGAGGSRISYTNSRDDSMCTTNRMQGNYTPQSGAATAIPNDVEIIFVEGGTNDWGNNVTLGDAEWKNSPNYEVYAEACHVMFDNLTTLFPNAEIIVLGSPWAKWANHFTDTYGILNNNGLQSVDYGDVLLDVAGRWGIKGINMSRLIGFNDNNVASLTSDGVHPNTSGASKIASAVVSYLLSL